MKFEEKCLELSEYWNSFTYSDPVNVYEDAYSQNLEFKSKDIILNIVLYTKPYPNRSQVLQYRSLEENQVSRESYYIDGEVLVNCTIANSIKCNFYEELEDSNSYKEKVFNFFGREYSVISFSKNENISDLDIIEINKLVNYLLKL